MGDNSQVAVPACSRDVMAAVPRRYLRIHKTGIAAPFPPSESRERPKRDVFGRTREETHCADGSFFFQNVYSARHDLTNYAIAVVILLAIPPLVLTALHERPEGQVFISAVVGLAMWMLWPALVGRSNATGMYLNAVPANSPGGIPTLTPRVMRLTFVTFVQRRSFILRTRSGTEWVSIS